MLAGGGANAAYTAGVLKGWSAAGTRPQFDVVTGISSGALIAPFAFLGSEYDETLARYSAELRACDIYQRRRLLWALLCSDALTDSSPLERRIAEEITPDLLAKVAQAHAEGRRLYVGTTDLDTKRLVVWDLGAVASGQDPGRLELFRKVLLAASSVPAFQPPVAINVEVNGRCYTELHVDGGVTASLFLQPAMLGLVQEQEKTRRQENTDVYVVIARKLQPPTRPVQRRLLPLAKESIGALLTSRFEEDLLSVYRLTQSAGAHFALTAIPDDSPEAPDTMTFDPGIMRGLFDLGYRAGADRTGWRSSPPGLTPQEQRPPRGGTKFIVEEPQPKS